MKDIDKVTFEFRAPGTIVLLGIAFLILKVGGVIDWNWWWVLSPFWVIPAFGGLLLAGIFLLPAVMFVYAFLWAQFDNWRAKRQNRKFGAIKQTQAENWPDPDPTD